MKTRRVVNKAGYLIRIGGSFPIPAGKAAVIPPEYAEDPAIDRYIKAKIFEGELLKEGRVSKSAADMPEEWTKVLENTQVGDGPAPEKEAPKKEEPKEEAPSTPEKEAKESVEEKPAKTRRKRTSKKSETSENVE